MYLHSMSARRLTRVVLAAAACVAASSASAKDFEPGDLRICNMKRCLPIADVAALETLSKFYYSGPRPRAGRPAPLGAPAFELRFGNGYVTGVVATTRLDRFLSYGVHLGWFGRGTWYRVPDTAARELRRLTARLTPLRVTERVRAKSR